MNFSDLIKKLDEDLILDKTEVENNTIYLYCHKGIYNATCPYCGEESNDVHSVYVRKIKDLSIQEHEVK